MATPIADLVEKMSGMGVPLEAIILAIRQIEERDATVTPSVTRKVTGSALRMRKLRAKQLAKKSVTVASQENSAAISSPSNTESQKIVKVERDSTATVTVTAVTQWNEMAGRNPKIPQVQRLTPVREKKIVRTLKDLGGIDGWDAMLRAIEASAYLRGDNDRGWNVSIDWVVEPRNLTKIMEGNYRDRKPVNGAKSELATAFDRIQERFDAGNPGFGF